METYKKPVVAIKTEEMLIVSARSSVSFSAEPPDNNLQKINSRALTTRKDIIK